MIFFGSIHRVGENITSALIFDPSLGSNDPALLAAHCLEHVDPALAEIVAEGDILAAGNGFGTGEHAELAVLALQALGFAAIICASAAPTFIEIAESYGFPVIISAETYTLQAGQKARIDLDRAVVKNLATQAQFAFAPVSSQLLAAARRNAILGRMRKVVEEEGFEG